MGRGEVPRTHSALRSFFNDEHDQIVAEWTVAIARMRPASPALADALVADAPQLMAEIADLAEVARAAPIDRTFAIARDHVHGPFDDDCDVPRVLEAFAALRQCITGRWLRDAAPARAEPLELRALHTALDALTAAAVSQCTVASRAGVEQLAAARERALGKFESLLAASPVGMAFLDRDLRYLRINDALAALNGRPAEDHVGRTIGEMIPEAAAVVEPILRDVIARGEPVVNREVTRPSPSGPGGQQTYLATYFPVRAQSGEITGVGGVVMEITDVRRVQEDLRRVQEQMQAILERTPASIWVKDAAGRIVLANHRLADALGHPYEAVIGRRSDELLPPEVAAQHEAHDLIVAREHRAIEVEEIVPGPDGTRTFLSIKFPLPGNPPMVGAIATDISARKRMEEELRVAVRSRERVLAAVSHDLRNPLNAIRLTSATLLSQLSADQRWRRHLEIIHRSCLRMEHLIADLLDMASIGAGRLSLETRPEPAADILREALELHQPIADEKRIGLRLDGVAEGVLIECDRQRVMQVFENLIGNALKFSPAGGTVTLSCDRTNGAVCFSVADTGPGIQPELVTRLFDPYWSGPGSAGGGVGLGLYIARGIVERHGGRIDVDSTPGAGTRFSFTIPTTAG
jgi:PAS domain S-box-containing protein